MVIRKERFTIYPDMPYEKIEDMFTNVITLFGNHSIEAWEYYKECYPLIPIEFRLKLLFDTIYTSYSIDIEEFNEYVEDIIKIETDDIFDNRLSLNRAVLGELVDNNYLVTVYRGATKESLDSDYAYSWTYDRDVAFWFATKYIKAEIVSDPMVLTAKVPVVDILFITHGRNEKEVIILPPVIGGRLSIEKSESVSYDEDFMKRWREE